MRMRSLLRTAAVALLLPLAACSDTVVPPLTPELPPPGRRSPHADRALFLEAALFSRSGRPLAYGS